MKTCWLITAGLIALYIGLIEPQQRHRGIAMEKGTGLAAESREEWEPASFWRQTSLLPRLARMEYSQKGVIMSEPSRVHVQAALLAPPPSGGSDKSEDAASDRKLIRTANLNLVAKSPSETSERIIQLAQGAGGFLISSQVSGGADFPGASLTIRVPAEKFEEVRAQIRQLGVRVDGESVEAQDVTKQYVDHEARLRNLHAQEEQYLSILRKATTVKDTLEVSDKLNEVRGAIEERQAEFEALSKQIETVAVNITLRAEADAQVFGLHWRPLYHLKLAAREGLDGIGDYVSAMASFAFYLPTILLWLFTIMAGAAIGWRSLPRVARVFFRSPKLDTPSAIANS